MASRIQLGKVVTVKGKKNRIARSQAKGKKYVARPVDGKGGAINFGQQGATAKPGTTKGNSYCARSAGIKSSNKGAGANDFARMLWNCNGKKSMKK